MVHDNDLIIVGNGLQSVSDRDELIVSNVGEGRRTVTEPSWV